MAWNCCGDSRRISWPIARAKVSATSRLCAQCWKLDSQLFGWQLNLSASKKCPLVMDLCIESTAVCQKDALSIDTLPEASSRSYLAISNFPIAAHASAIASRAARELTKAAPPLLVDVLAPTGTDSCSLPAISEGIFKLKELLIYSPACGFFTVVLASHEECLVGVLLVAVAATSDLIRSNHHACWHRARWAHRVTNTQ